MCFLYIYIYIYIKARSRVLIFFFDMPMILLLYKKIYFNTNNLDSFISNVVISLLQDFEDDIKQSNSELSLICPIAQLYINNHILLFDF